MKELALNHLPELAPRTVESLNLLRLRLEQTAPDNKNSRHTGTARGKAWRNMVMTFR